MRIRLLAGLLSLGCFLIYRCEARLDSRTAPSPIVVAASQDWDGNDGLWSSFAIQIGTPPQNVKVLISTSAYETSAVILGGCISTDSPNCVKLRGGKLFAANESSTWVKNTANLSTNIYPISVAQRLGYNGNAALGFDDVTLGWPGSGGPTIKNQTVAGFVYGDFRLGFFGLTPRAANFTSFDDPIPSYMQNMVSQSLIPSTSWSYTAGNQYRLNTVLGSLILGGYDSSKFIPNGISFPFSSEDIRDLTLQVEGITTTDGRATTSLLPRSIPAFVDSSQPSFWLPNDACELFEKAFNLTWDSNSELYLLTGAQHSALLAQNPSVTFTLGNLTAGANVNITLPYAAFDLNVSFPLIADSTRYYFPLKRAANSTQYTLGRVFFQEAYVTADYDRGNFYVSQCNWAPNPEQNIVSILPPVSKTSNPDPDNSGTNRSASSHPVPIAPIVGGAVGGAALIGLGCFLIFWFCIRPQHRRRIEEAAAAKVAAAATASTEPSADPPPDPRYLKSELDSEEVRRAGELEAHKNQWYTEVDTSQQRRIYEVEGRDDIIYEMGGKVGMWAVEVDGAAVEVHELPAREEVAFEMRGSREEVEPARWSWEMTDVLASPASLPKARGEMIPEVSHVPPRSIRDRLSRKE